MMFFIIGKEVAMMKSYFITTYKITIIKTID